MNEAINAEDLTGLYIDCDLPFPLFEKASVSGDLSHIIRDGLEHTEDALREAWLKINDEYLQLTGDTASAGYADDLNAHAYTAAKVIIVPALCEIAGNTQSEEILSKLRELYPTLRFPADDKEQLADDLERVKLLLERDSMDLDQLSKKLEESEGGSNNGEAGRPKQETFDRIKIAINDHKKMVYDFEKLTTRQYAILVKSLKEVKTANEAA